MLHVYMKLVNDFSIVPQAYEAELDDKYGITLGDLRNGEDAQFQGDLEKNVSFSGGLSQSTEQIGNSILEKYEGAPGFCAMKIKDEKELAGHVKAIHELSYNHYVFGKESNMLGAFPNMCCGRSTRNLLLTSMERGYSNASLFCNRDRGHVYVGFPFVFGEEQEKGFIIADPTSDQLFDDKKNAPRNNVFVASGSKWKYETDWEDGADLFPGSDNNSTYANLHTLRSNPDSRIYESEGVDNYFSEVFKNPVDVNVEAL